MARRVLNNPSAETLINDMRTCLAEWTINTINPSSVFKTIVVDFLSTSFGKLIPFCEFIRTQVLASRTRMDSLAYELNEEKRMREDLAEKLVGLTAEMNAMENGLAWTDSRLEMVERGMPSSWSDSD